MKKSIKLYSEKDTIKLAEEIAPTLKKGDVIALFGELGTGKTFFTKHLCSFLGVTENVSSPSYVLMNEYKGKFPIYHLDLYRLQSPEEVLELGMHEFLDTGLTIIEWPKLAENILPDNPISICFIFEDGYRKAEINSLSNTLMIS